MKAIVQSACICLAACTIASGAKCFAAIIFPKAPEDGRQFSHKMVAELLQADTNAFKRQQLKGLTIINSPSMYSVGKKDIISD
jgi:hypothetical protein